MAEDILTVGGVVLPTPNSLTVSIMDVDGNSERNLLAELTRDRIAVKRKIEAEYKRLTDNQIQEILQAVSPVFFTLTYPDPYIGGTKTITAYCGDRSVPLLYIRGGKKYWSVKLSMTER